MSPLPLQIRGSAAILAAEEEVAGEPAILLESGSYLLMESGDNILIE